ICKDKLTVGKTCGGDGQCASNHCADGLCCNTDCQGQCEACGETGKEGTCTTVTGTPRGSRSACAGTGPCMAACDGNSATSCSYPDAAVTCTAGACANDVGVAASVCDGSGACTKPAPTSCGGF